MKAPSPANELLPSLVSLVTVMPIAWFARARSPVESVVRIKWHKSAQTNAATDARAMSRQKMINLKQLRDLQGGFKCMRRVYHCH